jgi:hypothetical protein
MPRADMTVRVFGMLSHDDNTPAPCRFSCPPEPVVGDTGRFKVINCRDTATTINKQHIDVTLVGILVIEQHHYRVEVWQHHPFVYDTPLDNVVPLPLLPNSILTYPLILRVSLDSKQGHPPKLKRLCRALETHLAALSSEAVGACSDSRAGMHEDHGDEATRVTAVTTAAVLPFEVTGEEVEDDDDEDGDDDEHDDDDQGEDEDGPRRRSHTRRAAAGGVASHTRAAGGGGTDASSTDTERVANTATIHNDDDNTDEILDDPDDVIDDDEPMDADNALLEIEESGGRLGLGTSGQGDDDDEDEEHQRDGDDDGLDDDGDDDDDGVDVDEKDIDALVQNIIMHDV